MVASIAPRADETFLEIGPGRGALTWPLAAASARVVAYEIDRELASQLRAAGPPNLTLIEGDFLESRAEDIGRALREAPAAAGPLRVAGNLPYNAASPILGRLLDLHRAGIPFRDATVMLQREVAERLLAPPGSRDYGVLSVLIRHEAVVHRLLSLPPGAFRPMPRVDSTLVSLRFHAPEPPARAPEAFAAMTRAIFSRRRKTLANALLAFPPAALAGPAVLLGEANIDGRRRPETLEIRELVDLSNAIADRTFRG